MYFYCHPLHPPPFCQKGTTFLGVCSHLSPETYTKYVIQSAGYLLSHRLHRLHRFSFVLRTPNLTTTYTTYTTSNGDTVAKGQVVLVVIVVLVVVNSKYCRQFQILSLTSSVPIRVHPMLHKICEICVTKKMPYYLAIREIVRIFAASNPLNLNNYGEYQRQKPERRSKDNGRKVFGSQGRFDLQACVR